MLQICVTAFRLKRHKQKLKDPSVKVQDDSLTYITCSFPPLKTAARSFYTLYTSSQMVSNKEVTSAFKNMHIGKEAR